MTIARLILPQGALLRWHERLAQRLREDGARVVVSLRPSLRKPNALGLCEHLERLLYARPTSHLSEPIGEGAWTHADDASADLTFDLTGDETPATGEIIPLYDGAPGEASRDAALIEHRTPRVQIARVADDGFVVLAEGWPANDRPWSLSAGREAVAARLITLARMAVRGGPGRTLSRVKAARASCVSSAPLLTGVLAARAASRLSRLVTHEHHWRIGWRRLGAEGGVMDRLGWPDGGWTWLPDDRQRYYADPFPFAHEGRTFVFCEEFPYATWKGVLSVFEIDGQGRADKPRVVLERPYHLSYPLVFRHEGQIWMMPESSTNRTLELYRAESFPDRWVFDRVLIEGMELSDATFFEADGRWWLTATTAEEGGSHWDCLSLFSGPGPLGPWTRCGAGPVLVDASAARPAGHVQTIGGRLWRPAQDCTRGYGSGLSLCRIDHVGEDGFSQTVAARLTPPSGAPPHGVHTLNVGGGYELIDAVGLRCRWGAPSAGNAG